VIAQAKPWERLLNSPWILLLIALNFLLGLGAMPLFDLDEGAFSSATMEMLQRGDYITTYMGGELRFDKPILIYWLQALSVSGFGLNEFALRLPSALCAIAWCWVVFRFVRTYLDQSRAVAAALLLAMSLVVSVIARAATADALLNLWLCLAICDAYRLLNTPTPGKFIANPLVLRAYLWVGLGVLAKGPVAILVPLAVAFLYALCARRWQHLLRLLFNPLGWLICLGVFMPWYIAEYHAQGQLFIDGFLFKHNLSRFNSTMEGHGGHLYYYLPVSLLVFMPVCGLFLQLVFKLRRFVDDDLSRFCWIWFGFVLVFFSFSNTQLPHYLLYGATPVFILVAKYREQLSGRWWLIVPPLMLLGLFAALPEIAKQLIAEGKKEEVAAMLSHGMGYLDGTYRTLVLLAMALILVIGLSHLAVTTRQLLVTLVFGLTFGNLLLPTYGKIQQLPVQEAVAVAKTLDKTIVMDRHDMPSFSVYLGRVVPIRPPQAGEVVFTGIDQRQHFPGSTQVFNQGGVVLLQMPNVPDQPAIQE